MTTSERVGHLLVAIPVAHILGSAFFLWSYCFGFGANLQVHVSASDLFAVSISDMVKVYALALIFPLAITLMRITSATPYASEYINSLPDSAKDSAHAKHLKLRNFVFISSAIIHVLFVGAAFYLYVSGQQFSYLLMWIGVQIPATVVWMRFCEIRNFSNSTFESGTIILGFIVSTFYLGANQGQADRFLSYQSAIQTHTICSKAIVLRQVSSKYLAILPNGSRALISEDCKIVFQVPPPRIYDLISPPNPEPKPRPSKEIKGDKPSVKSVVKPAIA